MKCYIVLTVLVVCVGGCWCANLGAGKPPIPCDVGAICKTHPSTNINNMDHCCTKNGSLKVSHAMVGGTPITDCVCMEPLTYLWTGLLGHLGGFLSRIRF